MSREKYLIKKLKYEYNIRIKKVKMADSGTYYIAYKLFSRDCCLFKEPINNKLYDSLDDILCEVNNESNNT